MREGLGRYRVIRPPVRATHTPRPSFPHHRAAPPSPEPPILTRKAHYVTEHGYDPGFKFHDAPEALVNFLRSRAPESILDSSLPI